MCAARYQLRPEVALLAPVEGARADELAAACPGLFRVEGAGPQRRAVAGDARAHPNQLEKVPPLAVRRPPTLDLHHVSGITRNVGSAGRLAVPRQLHWLCASC